MTLSHSQAKRFYDRFGSKQDKQSFYEDKALDELIAHALIEYAITCGCELPGHRSQ